jgi:hypothetical protein
VGAIVTGPAGEPVAPPRAVTLVWIDAREARVVPPGGHGGIERLESEVPAHHRSTGHVRHDPLVRHGGGGRPQTAGEPHRLEHLARFLDQVIGRLSPTDDLVIVGPGTVRLHLARRLRTADHRHGIARRIETEPAHPMTDPQLLAWSRALAGGPLRRLTAGTYRWSGAQPPMTGPRHRPRRVVERLHLDPDG